MEKTINMAYSEYENMQEQIAELHKGKAKSVYQLPHTYVPVCIYHEPNELITELTDKLNRLSKADSTVAQIEILMHEINQLKAENERLKKRGVWERLFNSEK